LRQVLVFKQTGSNPWKVGSGHSHP
jgi:hypothetical protein